MQDIQIAPVGAQERRALDGWLDQAAQQGIDIDDVSSIGGAYDAYVERMVDTAPEDREDPTPFCTMVGMAMGEHLVRRTPLEWRVVTDHEGTDLAVATPAEDAILFPVDPVASAWEVAEVGWMDEWVANLLAGMQGEAQ